MRLIGLTGPSGAGKTTVANLFASLGVPILDADAIYRELLVPPSACLSELTDRFGASILREDGTLDRPVLAKAVFGDPMLLEALNAIAHRHILAEAKRRRDALARQGHAVVLFDAPQLFESGADAECDAVVVVLADPVCRMHRIQARDGLDEEAILARFSAQKSDDFFRAHADYVIENNGSEADLLAQVRSILSEQGVRPS